MGYRKILCGVTCSENSQMAAAKAAELAHQSGAELVFFFVSDPGFLNGITSCARYEMIRDDFSKLAKMCLVRACDLARERGLEPREVVRSGAVREELRAMIEVEQPDVLVVGHEDRDRFLDFIFGVRVGKAVEEMRRELGIPLVVV